MRTEVPLNHASRLVNHGPTVLVSASHEGRANLMAAAWSMPVEFTPPRIAVVLDKSTYTRELVLASGRLALNIPCRAQADLCFTVGSVSGRPEPGGASNRPATGSGELAVTTPDKFTQYGIGRFASPKFGLPFVEGCVAWMECVLIREPHCEQAYDTFFVEVVAALADPRVFRDGRWSFRDDNTPLQTLHHLGGGVFGVPSSVVKASVLNPMTLS